MEEYVMLQHVQIWNFEVLFQRLKKNYFQIIQIIFPFLYTSASS